MFPSRAKAILPAMVVPGCDGGGALDTDGAPLALGAPGPPPMFGKGAEPPPQAARARIRPPTDVILRSRRRRRILPAGQQRNNRGRFLASLRMTSNLGIIAWA